MDAQGDQAILTALRAAFAAQGTNLAVFDTVATPSMFKTTDTDPRNLRDGVTVEVAKGYSNGGIEGRVYRYIGSDEDDVVLGTQNYSDTSRWLLLDKLKLHGVGNRRRL